MMARSTGILFMRAACLAVLGLCGLAHGQITIAEGAANILVATAAANAVKEPMLQVSVSNPAGSPAAEITQLVVTAGSNGSGHDVNDLTSGSVQLLWDVDGNGRLTTSGGTPDQLLGGAVYNDDNGSATISGFAVPLPAGQSVRLLVVYTFGAGATAGESFRARIAANQHVSVRNASTLAPMSVSGAPVEGYLRTIGKGTVTFVRVNQDPDGAVAIPNLQRVPLINLELIVDDVEDVTITSFSFKDVGSAHGVNGIVPDSVRLFQGNAKPTISSTPLAAGAFPSDGGTVVLTPASPVVIARGGKLRIWVTVDVVAAGSGVIGSKYQVQAPAANPLAASGAASTLAPNYVGTGANGPEWEFNYNPLIFSKGNDLGAVLIARTAQNAPVLAFQIQNDPAARSEKVTLTEFTFHAGGTINEVTDVTQVELWRDQNPRGKHNATDVLLGSGVFNANNGSVTINFEDAPITLNKNQMDYFLLTFDMSGQATNGETVLASLKTRNDFSAIGEVSLVNSGLVPTPFNGNLKTIGQPRAEFYLETSEVRVPTIIAPEAADFPLIGMRVKNLNDEDMQFKGLRVDLSGPLNEADYFTSLTLRLDADGDGEIDPADVIVPTTWSLTTEAANTVLSILTPDGAEYSLPRGAEKRFTLYAQVAETVIGDGSETFNFIADADDDIVALGATSQTPFDFTTPAPPFNLPRTIRNPAISVTNYPAAATFSGCINGVYGLVGSSFAVASGEDLIIHRVRFAMNGTLDDATRVASASTWYDADKNFLVSSSEAAKPFGYKYVTNPVSVDNGPGLIDFTDDPGPLKRTENVSLTVAVGFRELDQNTAIGQIGMTASAAQAGSMIIEGVGARSGRPIEVTNPAGDDAGRTINFSKGTLAVNQAVVDRAAAPPNGSNIETLALRFTTNILESVLIDSLKLTPRGTIDESIHIKPDGIKIYIDDNRNGKKDNLDYLYAVAQPPASDNGPITFTAANYQYGNGVYSFSVGSGRPYDQFLLTVDLAADAPEGTTVQFALESTGDVAATGELSLYPYALGQELTFTAEPPFIGPEILVERGAIDVRNDASFYNDADNKPMVTMVPNATAYEVARIDIKATPAEDVRVTGLTFRSNGTADELAALAPGGAALYLGGMAQNNLLTTATFTMDDGSVTFTDFRTTLTLINKTPADLRLAFTGSGSGQQDQTFALSLAGIDVQAIGLSSGLPITKLIPAEPYLPGAIRIGAGRLTIRASDLNDYILPLPTGQPTIIQRLQFSASRTEGVTLMELPVRGAGSADESQALESGAVQMNRRQGNNPPVMIGSAPFLPGDDGIASLRNLNIQVGADATTSNQYSLDVTVDPANAQTSTTLRMDLESTATVLGVGMLSGWPVEIVFDDQAGEKTQNVPGQVSGQPVLLSSGIVTLKKGSKTPANATIVGTESKVPLMQARLEVMNNLEGVTVTDMYIRAGGTANEMFALGQVYLYLDVDGDGRATAADVLLGTTRFPGNDAIAHFGGLAQTLPVASQNDWVIAADLTGRAAAGHTVKIDLLGIETLNGTGQLTELPTATLIGSPAPVGAIYTLSNPTYNAVGSWSIYE